MYSLKSNFILVLIGVFLWSCSSQEEPIETLPSMDDLKTNYVNDWEGFKPNKDDTIKILAIGNSFAVDAVRYDLLNFFKACGLNVKIGCLAISSCSLSMHLKNITEGNSEYTYYFKDCDDKETIIEQQSINNVLKSEQWSMLTLQQVSEYSGLYLSYKETLPQLLKMLRRYVGVKPKIALHQTWAYDNECEREYFSLYGHNQLVMYNAIVYATLMAMATNDIDFIIPSGTALQRARNTSLGQSMTRDGFHLDMKIGTYIVSGVWFESITGYDVREYSYQKYNLTAEEAELCVSASHWAVKHPFEIE